MHADVVIVGYGPVGQTLAILLSKRGHRVAVVERWEQAYQKPRAVVFDDEVARVFAAAGVAARFAEFSEPNLDYEWRNANGETLLRFSLAATGPSGWPESNMFTQPNLEAVLMATAESYGNVVVHRGAEAVRLRQDDSQVEVGLRDGRTLTASYVVGCDGANSFVRQQMVTTITDLGFFYDWLICDLITSEPLAWSPVNLQVCDPIRPVTVVSGGPGRRRWEFMRMPGDATRPRHPDRPARLLYFRRYLRPSRPRLPRRRTRARAEHHGAVCASAVGVRVQPYATTTVRTLVNSRTPSADSSRP